MRPVEMPEEFVKEMWCDWVAAGRTQGNRLLRWLGKNLSKMVLHPKTRAWLVISAWLQIKKKGEYDE